MKKNNHYERVFEAYIQFLGLPYVATRERQRSLLPENPEDSLKNFDFIVSTTQIFPPASWTSVEGKDYAKIFGSSVSFLPSIDEISSRQSAPTSNARENALAADGILAANGNVGNVSFASNASNVSDFSNVNAQFTSRNERMSEAKETERQENEASSLAERPEEPEIYYRPRSLSWLIDIKGRRFPSGRKQPQYWRNWVTSEDELGLLRWEGIFGKGFHGAFVFVYDVWGDRLPLPEERLFETNGRRYAFFFIPLAIYRTFARVLSTKWETETMSAALFQKYAVPLDEFLGVGFCAR